MHALSRAIAIVVTTLWTSSFAVTKALCSWLRVDLAVVNSLEGVPGRQTLPSFVSGAHRAGSPPAGGSGAKERQDGKVHAHVRAVRGAAGAEGTASGGVLTYSFWPRACSSVTMSDC